MPLHEVCDKVIVFQVKGAREEIQVRILENVFWQSGPKLSGHFQVRCKLQRLQENKVRQTITDTKRSQTRNDHRHEERSQTRRTITDTKMSSSHTHTQTLQLTGSPSGAG